MLFALIISLFSSLVTTPPPQARTTPPVSALSRIRVSISLKAFSPSASIITEGALPVSASIISSRSRKFLPIREASSLPMEVLPAPGIPIRTMFPCSASVLQVSRSISALEVSFPVNSAQPFAACATSIFIPPQAGIPTRWASRINFVRRGL